MPKESSAIPLVFQVAGDTHVKAHRLVPHFGFAFALLLASGCGVEPEADLPPPRATATKATKPDKRVEDEATKPAATVKLPVQRPIDLPAVTERSALLQRLPKSSLFVLRVPKVGRLAEAYKRSSFRSMVAGTEFSAGKAQMTEGIARVEAGLRAALPDYDALREQVMSIDGESVLALVSVDIAAFTARASKSNDMPFHVAWMFDAGRHASTFDALTQRALKSIETHAAETGGTSTTFRRETIDLASWRTRVTAEDVEFDLLREGSQFLLAVGPAPKSASVEHPLAMREIEDSFLAADITRGTKDLSAGGKSVVVEAYVNLEPVWSAVQLLAPAETKALLSASGAYSIRGLSGVAALGKTGIDEEILLMSPGGKDLLTKCLTSRPLEPEIARFVPEETSTATLCSFDFEALLTNLTKILPPSEKRDLENALLDAKKAGIDVRKDLIENIGPTFALVGDFDPASAFQSDGAGHVPQFAIVAQLHEGSRFRAMIDTLLTRVGARTNVQAKDIHGFKAYSTGAISLPTPDGRETMTLDPHWYIGDDVLVFSLSRPALARSLAASWRKENRGPRALATALERETSAFAVGMNAVEDEGAAATTLGRCTSLGIELSTKEGSGSATGYSFVACTGVLAAVAIPRLIVARNESKERAVTAVLRSIGTAENAFRARRLIDADGDGEGEFGTLAELTGSSALRNGAPAPKPPVLADGLVPGADGLLRKHGYVFRVDLSNRLTNAVEFDEKEFFAYAWPETEGTSPSYAFVIDATGTILRTDNESAGQRYAGIERMPRVDAARRVKAGGPKITGAMPRSSDGGLWRDL